MLNFMQADEKAPVQAGKVFLGIDTCGVTGTVALARWSKDSFQLLGQIEMDGRNCSSLLVAGIGELLAQAGLSLPALDGIVAVYGPGSFTGVRIGLSAAKGIAEATQLPVFAVSRLEVMTASAGVSAAAIDAHRHEVFLRVLQAGSESSEKLAGAGELAEIAAPVRVAICDEATAALLSDSWPTTELVRVPEPTASDAIRLCAPRLVAGECVDVAQLDGYYLRRSDAEIFGEQSAPPPSGAAHA